MKKTRIALVLVTLAGMTSSSPAAVVFQDDFASAGTSPGTVASDFGWYRYGSLDASTLPGTAPENYFSVKKGTDGGLASQFGVYKNIPSFGTDSILQPGENLTVSLTLVGALNMVAGSFPQFRLFLGTSVGTTLADSDSAMSVASGSRQGLVYQQGVNTGTGAFARFSTGTTASPGTLNSTLIGGWTSASNVMSGANTGLPNFQSFSDPAQLTLSYSRIGANLISLSGSYTHPNTTVTAFNDILIDATGSTFTFDTIGIGLRDWTTDRELRFSEITLDYLPLLPEPSTAVLLLIFGTISLLRLKTIHINDKKGGIT